MIETTAVPATGTAPRQSRRRFLSRAGSLAALTALTGTGVLTWRTASQGVLAPATGRAYEAWGQFRARSPQPLDLVRAAVLAANAHNTQPWRFRLYPGRIDLYAVPDRTTGTMDQLRREMYISLGCALENLTLAAEAAGLAPSVQVAPDPADPTLAASVRLGAGAPVDSPLYRAIPDRHTNRGPYRTGRAVPAGVLDELAALATEPATGVIWWTGAEDRRAFADLTVRATKAIVADAAQAADDYRWWRGTRPAIQHFRDGITLDASGLPPARPGRREGHAGPEPRRVRCELDRLDARHARRDRGRVRRRGGARSGRPRAAHPGRPGLATPAPVGHRARACRATAQPDARTRRPGTRHRPAAGVRQRGRRAAARQRLGAGHAVPHRVPDHPSTPLAAPDGRRGQLRGAPCVGH